MNRHLLLYFIGVLLIPIVVECCGKGAGSHNTANAGTGTQNDGSGNSGSGIINTGSGSISTGSTTSDSGNCIIYAPPPPSSRMAINSTTQNEEQFHQLRQTNAKFEIHLFHLQEHANHKCIKKKGVCIPTGACEIFNGTTIKKGCTAHDVCCIIDVTRQTHELVAPLVKNSNISLESSNPVEFRTMCKPAGLLGHYCKDVEKCCTQTVHIGFDHFEWVMYAKDQKDGKDKKDGEKIKTGDLIAIGVEQKYHYLSCNSKKCHVMDLCKSKRYAFKIYNANRKRSGAEINQGDSIMLESVKHPGLCLTNDNTKPTLSDVHLTTCSFETSRPIRPNKDVMFDYFISAFEDIEKPSSLEIKHLHDRQTWELQILEELQQKTRDTVINNYCGSRQGSK